MHNPFYKFLEIDTHDNIREQVEIWLTKVLPKYKIWAEEQKIFYKELDEMKIYPIIPEIILKSKELFDNKCNIQIVIESGCAARGHHLTVFISPIEEVRKIPDFWQSFQYRSSLSFLEKK